MGWSDKRYDKLKKQNQELKDIARVQLGQMEQLQRRLRASERSGEGQSSTVANGPFTSRQILLGLWWGFVLIGFLVVISYFVWTFTHRPSSMAESVAEAPRLFPILRDSLYGYIDAQGGLVIPLRFDVAALLENGHIEPDRVLFSGGLAPAKYGDNWGYIDTTGHLAIEAKFAEAKRFSEGRAFVQVEGQWGVIDNSGAFVKAPSFEDAQDYARGRSPIFSEGLAPVVIKGSYGYVDRAGEIVIEPQFDRAFGFHEGFAAVRIGRKRTFIDKSGKIAFRLFDDVNRFSMGQAPVMIDSMWGGIDRTGALVIPLSFDYARPFAGGLAAVRQGERYGFIDSAGKLVIEARFERAGSFYGGLAWVQVDSLYGFIDSIGTLLIEPQFDYAYDFGAGVARIVKDDRFGYIDTIGNYIWKPGR